MSVTELSTVTRPLADRLRPLRLSEFTGQSHLLAAGKPLHLAFEQSRPHSCILWGPPGCGKTTLARLLASASVAHFQTLSAVTAGVKDIRAAVEQAQVLRSRGQPTVLFVDEVHRFNKSQQDALLPYVEDGTVTLIGATTENPSFELNSALLSRCRVYVLKPLQEHELTVLLQHAVRDERGYGGQIGLPAEAAQQLAAAADGDARRALSLLELASAQAQAAGRIAIEEADLQAIAGANLRRFDKGGEQFYDQISALHKAVRGSDPDAALYWLLRMLDGGADPAYVARRLLRIASEDIGNADPRALTLTLDAWQAFDRLGSPEGELVLAQAVVYLACAPKSNAVYLAAKAVRDDIAAHGTLEVPLHLRNAPTKLMKSLDYGKTYRYAHDEPDAFAAGETYLPEALAGRHYYEPVSRGLEIRIREKLDRLRALNREAQAATRKPNITGNKT